jgi:hypothetical protein
MRWIEKQFEFEGGSKAVWSPRFISTVRPDPTVTPILRNMKQTAALIMLMAVYGCGGSVHNSQPAPDVPVIVTQPQDSIIPISQTATFSVYAVGAEQLSYQWSKNGDAIQGATSPSYTTPAVTSSDSGSTFSVVVSNGPSSVTSRSALLTVGPGSVDLRFQLVGLSPAENIWGAGWIYKYLEYPFGFPYQNVLGSPLRLGGVDGGSCVAGVAQDCTWTYTIAPSPPGLTLSASYFPDVLEDLDADLASYTDASSVVTSWDIESGNDVFAMAWMKGPATGFDYKHEIVAMSGLDALVASDGANSRVVTAISFDGSGQVHFLSYGWASDKTTVYDTAVATASFDDVPSQAASLANAGYIITAFGGNQTDGYVMVGTKVHGDTMPRPILTYPPATDASAALGYAMVGNAQSQENGVSVLWIFEK